MKPEYFKAICKMAVYGAQGLTDEWLVENNITVKKSELIFKYGDKLYRTVKNNTKFDGKNIPGEDDGKYFQEIVTV